MALAGRRAEPLLAAAADAAEKGQQPLAVQTGVCDPESVQALFDTIEHRFESLDLLFNNAGVNAQAAPLDEWLLDQWFKVLNTTVTGVFLCARAAFDLMRRQNPQGGRIISNGSISAHTPHPCTAPYTASQHTVTGLTKSLVLGGRAFGIVASQINIGNSLTGLSERMTRGVMQANGAVASDPMMDAHRVADAVRHIAARPLSDNVLSMTAIVSNMPFVGRGRTLNTTSRSRAARHRSTQR